MKQLNTHLSAALVKLSADQVKAIKGNGCTGCGGPSELL